MNRYKKNISVLFVCLGNICRSPTAEGVFRQFVEKEYVSKECAQKESVPKGRLKKELDYNITVDSAGTSGWHIGSKADARSIAAAKVRGYDLSVMRGRQVTKDDFNHFDYILAMDENNLSELQNICPENYPGVLALFLDFAQDNSLGHCVPDPYHGDMGGFDHVLDLVENASRGLLQDIRSRFV